MSLVLSSWTSLTATVVCRQLGHALGVVRMEVGGGEGGALQADLGVGWEVRAQVQVQAGAERCGLAGTARC